MKEIIEFLTTKEVLIILGILAVILFLYFVFWFMEFLKKNEAKKKLKNNTLELNRLVEQVAEENDKEVLPEVFNRVVEATPSISETKEELTTSVQKVEVKEEPIEEAPVTFENGFTSPIEIQPVVVKQEVIKEVPTTDNLASAIEILDIKEEITDVKKIDEQIQYKEEVYTKTEAQAELEKLTEELQKASEEEKNISLTDFEVEQEENAIISLEELLAKGKTITAKNEITQYEDEGNEPISIEELEQRYQAEKKITVQESLESNIEPESKVTEIPKVEQVALFDLNTAPYQNTTGYRPSPIISPIYGIESQHLETKDNLSLENTANYEKLDEEIRKTNEFLNQLRELQKKLD